MSLSPKTCPVIKAMTASSMTERIIWTLKTESACKSQMLTCSHVIGCGYACMHACTCVNHTHKWPRLCTYRLMQSPGPLSYSLSNTITTSYLTLLSMKSVLTGWGCAEIYGVTLMQLSLTARQWWEWRMRRQTQRCWWVSADSSSVAQCEGWYLLLRQQGLNQVSLQWVEMYLYVQTYLRLCEEVERFNILVCWGE